MNDKGGIIVKAWGDQAAVPAAVAGRRHVVALALALLVALAGALALAERGEAATKDCSSTTDKGCLKVDDSKTDPIQPSNAAANPPVATYIAYAVTASNEGSVDLHNSEVRFTVPARTDDPRCKITGEGAVCTLKTLRPGQSTTLHVAVQTPDRTATPTDVSKQFKLSWQSNRGVSVTESTTVRDTPGQGQSWVLPNTYVHLTTDPTGRYEASLGDPQLASLTIPPQPNLAEAFLATLRETDQTKPFDPCTANLQAGANCGIGTWTEIDAPAPKFDPPISIGGFFDSSLVAGRNSARADVAYSKVQPYEGQCIVAAGPDADPSCIQIITQRCTGGADEQYPCFTIQQHGGALTDPRFGDWTVELKRTDNGYMRVGNYCIPEPVAGIRLGSNC